jgi:tetratricopeptide (TPR) repeat protein
MAKKKRKPPKTKRTLKRPGRSRPDRGSSPRLPSLQSLEGVMRQLVGQLTGAGDADETPLGQAQQLMYEAFGQPDRAERLRLARRALAISPDCADAYVLLAENAPSRKEALALYQQGVEAGERALGAELFRDQAGHFWGILETRPYMRARLGMAETLWAAGRRDEAVAHLLEMLRLNPGDNQGVRYTLLGWLLNLGRDEDLEVLLGQFSDDGSAAWAYTRALLAFRRQGDTPESWQLLKDAKKINKHVPAYLLGRTLLPGHPPDSYSFGDPNEAVLYAGGALAGWKATPGAMAWLKALEQGAKKRSSRLPRPQGPLPLVKTRLKRLEQAYDVWQADSRQFPHWIEVAGERVHPWVVLVTSRSSGLVLAHSLIEEPPTADQVWDTLASAMQKPMMGEPHRPSQVQVRADPSWAELTPHFDAIGVEVVVADELDQLNEVYEDLRRHLAGDQPPGLLEMPGIGPAQVAGFYQSAAQFYRRAPWRSLGFEAAIRVECRQFDSGPWYALVMGQSGLTFGVALYDDLGHLKKLWANELSDEESARETVALSVTFGDESEIPFADLEACRKHGWDLAGPEAYPSIFRKERGLSMRPPLAWELELMEGCLRALPDFVARHPLDDTSRLEMTVPVASRKLNLVLSWVDD